MHSYTHYVQINKVPTMFCRAIKTRSWPQRVYSPVRRSKMDYSFLLTCFKVLPCAKHHTKYLTQYLLIYFARKLYEVISIFDYA